MFLILLALLIVLICAYDYSIRSTRVWRHLLQFPGETALPLIGNALQLGTGADQVQINLKRIWEKHGRKNFRVVYGTEPMLMVAEMETAKKILSSNIEIQKSDQHVRFLRDNFGQSLVMSQGEHWRTMRKILTPVFHFKLLEQYLDVANSEGEILMGKLREHAGGAAFNIHDPLLNYNMDVICSEHWRTMRKILTPVFHFKLLEQYLDVANSEGEILMGKLREHAGGAAFNIHDPLLNYNMDVICSTTLGINVHAQSGGEQEYVQASRKILPLAIRRFYSIWHRYDLFYNMSQLRREDMENYKRMTDSLDRIIEHRKSEFEKNILPNVTLEGDVVDYISKNRSTLTFIDILLMSKMPDGTPISLESIREETNLIIFAGFDTTLTTLSFTLSNFAKYKGMQDRAYQEQLEIFGEDAERDPTLQDLNNMKYLQRFVKETMRMFPTVAHFGRHINNDIMLEDGRLIASGTNITFFVPGLHFNPEQFPNPDTFNPDRFLDPVPIYSYLPFSAGPRNCIGMNYAWMEMRTVLSKILRNFELSLERDEDFPTPVNQFIMTSRNGHKVKLTERKGK